MAAELALVAPPDALHRVERIADPLRFSLINPVDAEQDRAGNRFDVPGAGVLYAASTRQGAYAETLARFRASARLIARLRAIGAPAEGGVVPAPWRAARRIRRLRTLDALPFVDVEAPRSHTALTREAADVLLGRGLETLDVATLRGPSRLLTRGLAAWLYAQTDDHGEPRFGGIRYLSRLGDHECWAVFEGTAVELIDEELLRADDPALAEIAAAFDLVVR